MLDIMMSWDSWMLVRIAALPARTASWVQYASHMSRESPYWTVPQSRSPALAISLCASAMPMPNGSSLSSCTSGISIFAHLSPLLWRSCRALPLAALPPSLIIFFPLKVMPATALACLKTSGTCWIVRFVLRISLAWSSSSASRNALRAFSIACFPPFSAPLTRSLNSPAAAFLAAAETFLASFDAGEAKLPQGISAMIIAASSMTVEAISQSLFDFAVSAAAFSCL
mmetsp:Transcript_80636/g.246495  ORF Transcript_80636/g.246495 Transcript_80636/m.246495 type:complete len:227 (+) Transcript_80636:244-924(+)